MCALDWTKTRFHSSADECVTHNHGKRSKTIHNQYDGVCSYCGKSVDRNQGLMEMNRGKWSVIHIECAMERAKQ